MRVNPFLPRSRNVLMVSEISEYFFRSIFEREMLIYTQVVAFLLIVCGLMLNPESPKQCLSQDLETGCLKLAVVKFLGVQNFKGDHNIFISKP